MSDGQPAIPFTTTRLVEFHHCDPAGIVFYPRYFEMLNSVVSEWFGARNDLPFPQMHTDDRRGVPTVHLDTTFKAASRLGDQLVFAIVVRRIGRSSVDLTTTCSCAGETRFTCDHTLVFMDLDKTRAVRWTDTVRARLAEQLEAETAHD